jgi:hypothetical protein
LETRHPNSLRYATPTALNFSVSKNAKSNERASLQFWATAEDVFNHRFFTILVPNLENAGLIGFNIGFAPSLIVDSIPESNIAATRRLCFWLDHPNSKSECLPNARQQNACERERFNS